MKWSPGSSTYAARFALWKSPLALGPVLFTAGEGEKFAAKVAIQTDLPHSLTIESLGIDVLHHRRAPRTRHGSQLGHCRRSVMIHVWRSRSRLVKLGFPVKSVRVDRGDVVDVDADSFPGAVADRRRHEVFEC